MVNVVNVFVIPVFFHMAWCNKHLVMKNSKTSSKKDNFAALHKFLPPGNLPCSLTMFQQ